MTALCPSRKTFELKIIACPLCSSSSTIAVALDRSMREAAEAAVSLKESDTYAVASALVNGRSEISSDSSIKALSSAIGLSSSNTCAVVSKTPRVVAPMTATSPPED